MKMLIKHANGNVSELLKTTRGSRLLEKKDAKDALASMTSFLSLENKSGEQVFIPTAFGKVIFIHNTNRNNADLYLTWGKNGHHLTDISLKSLEILLKADGFQKAY